MNTMVDQEVDRANFIGGSDAAAILGISKWTTPLKVFHEKTRSPLFVKQEKSVFQRGKRWEAPALEMLIDLLEEQDGEPPRITARNQRYYDKEHPFLSCEVDFEMIRFGEPFNGEIKTVHIFSSNEWGEKGDEQVPPYYLAQSQWGMGITGSKRQMLGALFGADSILPFIIERDDETIAAMRQVAVDFWNDHVLKDIPPPPMTMADMALVLPGLRGRPVELSREVAALLDEINAIRQSTKAAAAREHELKFYLYDFIRAAWQAPGDDAPEENAILRLNGQDIATLGKQTQTRIDVDALRKNEPAIAAKYSKENVFRSLRFKKI